MMSLQTSTHSSQMKTVGPAISFRTSFWSLLQNEQRRISVSPFFFIELGGSSAAPPNPPARSAGVNPAPLAAWPPLGGCSVAPPELARGSSLPPADHLVHDTILLRLGSIHVEVAVGVDRDLLDGLAGVQGQDLVQAILHAQDLLGLDGDVGGLALGAAPGLMDHDPRVGQRETFALGSGRQQHA